MPQGTRERPGERRVGLLAVLWSWLVLGGLSNARWVVIGVLWVAALLLGFWGFAGYLAATGREATGLHTLYLALQLFTLESGSVAVPAAVGWQLEVARLMAPGVMAYTVVQALAVIFAQQFATLRLLTLRDHVVVCGLGRTGLALVKSFREQGYPVVVIESDEGNDAIEQCRDLGATVLLGDATEGALLRKARVPQARYLMAVCDDGPNAEVAAYAEEMVRDREEGTLTCFAHIVDLELCGLLRERELSRRHADAFRLEFFNVFESGARALLAAYPPFGPADPCEPHLLVVGLGRMGQTLVARAARDWSALDRADGRPLHITAIDQHVGSCVEAMVLRHPQLERWCRLDALEMSTQSPAFHRGDFLFDDQGRCDVTIAYICLDGDPASLAAALAVHRRLRRCARKIPIIVRVTQGSGLARLLSSDGGDFDSLRPFRLLDETCRPELLLGGLNERVARAIHEDYLRTELAKPSVALGDRPALVPWDELGDDYREANRHQAAHIAERLEAFGYHIVPLADPDAAAVAFTPDEVEAMARMEHDRWCAERRRAGWTHGTKRDNDRKLHPDLVPWDELDEEAREKDRVMVRDLPAFLAKTGLGVERLPAPSP